MTDVSHRSAFVPSVLDVRLRAGSSLGLPLRLTSLGSPFAVASVRWLVAALLLGVAVVAAGPVLAQRYDGPPSEVERSPLPEPERGFDRGPGQGPQDDDRGPPPEDDRGGRYDDGGGPGPRGAGDVRDGEDQGGPPPGVAPADYFYDVLKPLGRWVSHWRYGLVWYPNDVDEDWRPYTVGRWVLTDDYGWMWDSEEPWGWAVFHYGRWTLDEDWGWIWIPGNEWAPAWVDWREGEGHVGWAPLPPEVVWRDDRFDYRNADLESQRYRTSWIFVPAAALTSYSVYRYVTPRSRNVTYLRQSRRTTNYTFVNRTFVNRSVDPRRIERATGRPVVSVRIVDASRPDYGRRRGDGARGDGGRGGDGRRGGDGGVSVRIGEVEIFRPFDRGRRRANIDPAALPPSAGVAGAAGGRGNRGDGQRGDGQRGEGRGGGRSQGAGTPAPTVTPVAPATGGAPAAGAPTTTATPPGAGAPVGSPAAGAPTVGGGGDQRDGARGDG
ncbi:MAG: hypothetical protein K2Y05_05575, partial [Hyphomicrobiaceae bacterium]|nr:hypothetical protein [Hyphomicrobiaceae bacterium]